VGQRPLAEWTSLEIFGIMGDSDGQRIRNPSTGGQDTMTNAIWRYFIAAILIAHGLGHAGGPWFFRRSWLVPRLASGPARWLFIIQWMVAGIGFVAAAFGLLGIGIPSILWRALAIAASLLSGVVAILFVNREAGRPLFNAMAMDTVILVSLLVFDWPPASLVGS
jgi:hypothetical protein